MKTIKQNLLVFTLALLSFSVDATEFLWGVASAAYQTEGAYLTDGKGLSNWDYLTSKEITKHYNGEVHTGNVAVDGYHRYEEDIALIEELGANSYRFSVSWARVLPDGKNVNPEGIAYYKKLIDLLKKKNIRPMITIYHWDMPINLYMAGGQKSEVFVDFYRIYANLLFDEYGNDAVFITFNEPINETFELVPMTNAMLYNDSVAYNNVFNDEKTRAHWAAAVDNILIANANAISDYKSKNLSGKIGITIAFSPQIMAQAGLRVF